MAGHYLCNHNQPQPKSVVGLPKYEQVYEVAVTQDILDADGEGRTLPEIHLYCVVLHLGDY